MAYPLLTLVETKLALGMSLDATDDDANLAQAISWSSDAIRAYTERDFGIPQVTETRTFQYEGGGIVEIDDAQTITGVTLTPGAATPVILTSEQWEAQPYRTKRSPVYTYIALPQYFGYASPEMGFTRNLDVLWAEGRIGVDPIVASVTATWGWPAVPDDVKMAAVWAIADFKETPGPFVSESIAGYSRTVGTNRTLDNLPRRVRMALDPYTRVNV